MSKRRLNATPPNKIGLTFFLIVLFSKIISNAWLAKSLSMDAIVKVSRQKKKAVMGRDSFMRTMGHILASKKVVCVYGAIGVGKTHAVMKALEDESYIEFTSDHMKQLDVLSESTSHIVVDDIETDTHVWSTLTSRDRLSRGSTIYITNNIKGGETFDCIHMEPLAIEYQIKIAKSKCPGVEPSDAIRRARGNLKNLFSYLDGWDDKDVFMSPKDVIHDLLCKSDMNITDYLGRVVEEHGYSCGVLHENYTDARGADHLTIADNLSIADVYDTSVYRGDWEQLPYFCHHGIVAPALNINHGLIREAMRPGSSWTKFNNFKMRKNKLSTIMGRCRDLTLDRIQYIQKKCALDPDGALETLVHYKFTPPDIDVINHLGTVTKIKPKVVKRLKKELSDALG